MYNAAGELVGRSFLSFGYVKSGEESQNAVILSVRTELSWEKEALGYTPENSIKAILFGQNIQSGYWGLFKTSDLAGLSTAQLGQVAKSSGDAFTEEELAKINGKESLVPFLVGLNSGTSYTLLVSAFNGYFSKVYAVEQTTAGKEDPMQQKYKFDDGKGENIQVAVYDAGDLTWKRSIDWEPASGQVEVCGLAVDRDRNMVWMADWVDGRYLYGYDLATGKYVRKVHLRPVPQWQQGIYMDGGQMLISADDGDADLDEPDNLYIADLRDGKSYAAVLPFRMMSDFRRAGEIEGLTVDPATDELLVLSNRGSRIVLGMVRGFYPGYDSELHEVYVYEKVK